MSDDKGYLLPEGDIDGYPLICVTMKIPDTPEYRRDFIGHMWLLGKWWSWQHGTRGDTRATRAAEYWRGLLFDYFRMEDCPVDCCDDILAKLALLQQGFLDQSALNLVNQVTAGDLASQGLRDALDTRYDGTPTSINPNAPTTNFGASGDRYDALCAGLTAFVYGFARIQVDHLRVAQVGGLIAIALVAGLLIPGLNFFLIVGASVAVLLGAGTVGATTEVSIEALTDKTALGNVICCMRDKLKALSVTEANWLTALSACSFGSGTHEQIISDFITPTLAQNYLTILNILGQAYTGVINGEQLPDCPCAPPPACFEFAIDQQGWTHPTPADAQYAPSVGWGQINNTYLTIDSPQDGTIIHSVKIKFSRAWTGVNDYDKFFVIIYSWGGSGFPQYYPGGGALAVGQEVTITTTGTDWVDMRIQVVAGGLTFPPNPNNTSAQFITEVCYNPS